jgi:carbamoyltransferase
MPTEAQMDKYDPKDIAAWLQDQFETILVKFFSTITIKAQYLCLGGGCGLNVLANAAIIKAGLFKDIHIFPAANDSGLCFGGAIYKVSQKEKVITIDDDLGFLGKLYYDEEIENALQ